MITGLMEYRSGTTLVWEALRCLSDSKDVSTSEIAAFAGVPTKATRRILKRLVKAGLVQCVDNRSPSYWRAT